MRYGVFKVLERIANWFGGGLGLEGPLTGPMGSNIIIGVPGESVTVSSTQVIASVQQIPPSTSPGGSASTNFTTSTSYDGQTRKWQLSIDFRSDGSPRADVLTYTLEDGTKGFLIIVLKSPTFKSLTYQESVDNNGTLLLTVTYSQEPVRSHTSVSSMQIPHWAQPKPDH